MLPGDAIVCRVERNLRNDAAVVSGMLAMLRKSGGGGGPANTGANG